MPTSRSWVLRRFADVQAALAAPELVPPGTRALADPAHRDVQRSVVNLLPVSVVRAAMPALREEAQRLLVALPATSVRDFVGDVAVPWSEAVTSRLLGLDWATLASALPLAQGVFDAASMSDDGETTEDARHAAAMLAALLGGRTSPAVVQTFVALSQSLPGVVSGMMLALLEHPAQLGWLRAACRRDAADALTTDALTADALTATALTVAAHELLRYATPTTAVYRRALAPVRLGGCDIAAGDLVVVRLAEANRDGTAFPDPDRLDLSRGAPGHVAFGAGVHRCSGAVIVRLLVECMLEVLVTCDVTLAPPPDVGVTWNEGLSLRTPKALPVCASDAR